MNERNTKIGFLATTLVALLGLSLAVQPTLAATYYPIIVPGSNMTSPQGVNVRSQVVGYYSGPTGGFQGFLLSHGKYRTVNYLGAPNTLLSGINEHEQIVGYYDDGIFIHGFTRIHGKFTAFDYPGASNTYASGIDNAARIVDFYQVGGFTGGHGYELVNGNFTAPTSPARPRLTPPGSISREIFADRFSMRAASYMDLCCTRELFKRLTFPIPLERMQMA